MKRFVFQFGVASMVLPFYAFADHSDMTRPNPPQTFDHSGVDFYRASNLAYQLADLGERWAYNGYNYQLSQSANYLHNAASELYHFLRNGGRGGFRLYDHNPGYDSLDSLLYQVANAVNRFSYAAPYRASSQAQSYYNSLRYSLGR